MTRAFLRNHFILVFNGAGDRNRTYDPLITNAFSRINRNLIKIRQSGLLSVITAILYFIVFYRFLYVFSENCS